MMLWGELNRGGFMRFLHRFIRRHIADYDPTVPRVTMQAGGVLQRRQARIEALQHPTEGIIRSWRIEGNADHIVSVLVRGIL